MTPKEKAEAKEKAKRLVETYSIWCWNEGVCDYHLAKILALIAVDEIINSNPIFVTSKLEGKDGMHEAYLYWKKVKQEIGSYKRK